MSTRKQGSPNRPENLRIDPKLLELDKKELHTSMLPQQSSLLKKPSKPPTPASILAMRAGVDQPLFEDEEEVKEEGKLRLALVKVNETQLD